MSDEILPQPPSADESGTVVAFNDLVAPEPAEPDPPPPARWLAFLGVIVGGLLGALVGYGIGDVMYPTTIWASVGGLLGAVTGAAGLGVLANLTLRAMNEWRSVSHPESASGPEISSTGPPRRRVADRTWSRRPTS